MALGLSVGFLTSAYPSPMQCVIMRSIIFGPTALAAQFILINSTSTTFQAPLALAQAISVRVAFFF